MNTPDNNCGSNIVENTASKDDSISPKNKCRSRGKKRKRSSSCSSSDHDAFPENILEVEKNLQEAALRNNLDKASVKKIIKKVVGNDHVLALVKLQEEQEEGLDEEDKSLQPKLTRAKAKELMKVSTKSAPWNIELTPIKHIPVKTRPEVKALIAQELPDDEDDEEYKPTQDDVLSDDDHTLESCSDIDSQPRTPATPSSQCTPSPKPLQDGPFKVPQTGSSQVRRKLNLAEEPTIALRTRSKLSLSTTSIEHIESSFNPPDDLPNPVVDEIWNQFLVECLNPGPSTKHEDDDETDPEYSVAADPDANEEDEETLENSIIKISKKELNDLMTELFDIIPESTADKIAESLVTDGILHNSRNEISWEGKQEPTSDEEINKKPPRITFEKDNTIRYSIGKTEMEDHNYSENITPQRITMNAARKNLEKTLLSSPKQVEVSVNEQPILQICAPAPPQVLRAFDNNNVTVMHINVAVNVQILPEQVQILQQQLRQHVQLAATNFLQLYVNPVHWAFAPQYKEYIETFHKMHQKNPQSVVNVSNLNSALELVLSWEKSVSENTPENNAMVHFIQKEAERCRRRAVSNSLYVGDFHETFLKTLSNCVVVHYPYLLPAMPYRPENPRKSSFLLSEDHLIALGLDQFWEYVDKNPELFKLMRHPRTRTGLTVTLELISKYMMPWISTKKLMCHINHVKKTGGPDNPINILVALSFYATGSYQRLVAGSQGTMMSQQSVSRAIREVTDALNTIANKWIKFPQTREQRDIIKQRFYEKFKIPAVTGCIDGTHVAIIRPSQYEERFYNRKGFHSRNVLIKWLAKRIVEPVKHKIIPISPNMTLYEHPEDELPKIWLRYLAKSSKRFRKYLYRRPYSGTPSDGIPVNIGDKVIVPNKSPLPIDFTKPILSNRINIHPKKTETLTNRIDVNILHDTSQISPDVNILPNMVNIAPNTANMSPNVANTGQQVFTIVKTTTGSFLVPLSQVTTTVNSNTTPITTPMKIPIKPKQTVLPTTVYREHCPCCYLIRKTFKRQTKITEFFTRNKTCPCKDRKHERITTRLKFLVKSCKKYTKLLISDIECKIDELNRSYFHKKRLEEECPLDPDDLELVSSFQQRLMIRMVTTRDTMIKRKYLTCLEKYNLITGDPLELAKNIENIFDVELVDMFKEFLCFLTVEQACKMNKFKDYFVHHCVRGLIRKVEQQISNKKQQEKVLLYLKSFINNKESFTNECEICIKLLNLVAGYPKLAEYIFSLFPHLPVPEEPIRTKEVFNTKQTNEIEKPIDKEAEHNATMISHCEHSIQQSTTVDYEADHSSSEEEYIVVPIKNEMDTNNECENVIVKLEMSSPQPEDNHETNTLPNDKISPTSDIAMQVIIEQETIKTEPPEWKREEDKLILELLKENMQEQNERVAEMFDDENILKLLCDHLPHKAMEDIKERMVLILEMLVIK